MIAFPRSRLAPYAWAVPSLVAVLLVYLPDIGHGFIKDDFAWIRASRVSGVRDLLALFGKDNGFYRPLVSLTFAFDHRLFGLHPFAYGLTNLVLLLADAGLLVGLGRALRMPAGTAVFAAAVWTLNPHGIPMAVLWISGRTALALTLFALLAAVAFVRGRPGLAACCALFAMLAKEEAVLLPLVLLAWSRWLPPAVKRAWLPLLALIPYLLLRARTGAYLPHTAPAFYRPSLDPALVARNVFEYADRACTFGLLVVLLASLLCWRRPRLDGPLERSWVVLGLIWLVAGYGLTVFLPVRSSLYACFPSVGSALAAAACAQSVWNASPDSRRRLRAAAVTVPLLLVPIHWSRAARWVRPAELTEQALADLKASPAPGVALVLHDAAGGRASLSNAFGTLIEDAVRLSTGDETARVWIDPPPPDWEGAGLRPPEPGQPARHFALRDGRLVLVH